MGLYLIASRAGLRIGKFEGFPIKEKRPAAMHACGCGRAAVAYHDDRELTAGDRGGPRPKHGQMVLIALTAMLQNDSL